MIRSYREIEKILARLEAGIPTVDIRIRFKDGSEAAVSAPRAVDLVHERSGDILSVTGGGEKNGLLPQLLNDILTDDPDPESES